MTELVEVEILGQTITHQYGTLNTGDILRTTAKFAAHLVDDCGAAKYTKAKTPAAPAAETPPAPPTVPAKPHKKPAK